MSIRYVDSPTLANLSRDRDSVGPLGKSAMDVALMLDVLVDADGK